VVAPYATALAAMIDAPQSATNLRQLISAGLEGDYGFFDAIDYTTREDDHHDHAAAEADSPAAGTVVRTYFAHHAGMTVVALANALLGDSMVKRFHSDPRVQATELLLQERVPRHTPTIQPRPLDEQTVSRNGIPSRQRRAALPSTRSGSSGAGRVGGARLEPRRSAAGARRMGDGSRTIPRSRSGH
jgi:cyclic beta-1,2-glucan synthetase